MSKEYYLEKYLFNKDKNRVGINAMSISDITGIPRATVFRKLNKLIKLQFLLVDEKKQYLTTGVHKEKLIAIQKNNFINLSKFATRIYNLSLMKNN
jgi:DNA-binding IclR family transcriptional regulator